MMIINDENNILGASDSNRMDQENSLVKGNVPATGDIQTVEMPNNESANELSPAQMATEFLKNNIFVTFLGHLYWFVVVYMDSVGPHGYYEKVELNVLQMLRRAVYSVFAPVIDAYRNNATKALDNILDFIRYKCPAACDDAYDKFKIVFRDGIFCDISNGVLQYGFLKPSEFCSKYFNMLGRDFMLVQGYPTCLAILSSIEWPENPALWAQCILEQIGFIICGSSVEKSIPAWRGVTNSFKSTLFNTAISLWDVTTDIFVQDLQSFGNEFGADNLEGKRVAYFPDIQQGRLGTASVSKIKQLSGNDPSRINTKFKTGRSGSIDIPIMIISNGPIMLGDSAAEGRCVYTPFPVSIKDQAVINDLVQRFQAENVHLIKAAIEAHAKRIREGRPLCTPWPLNSYVNDFSSVWQDRLWRYVRQTLVKGEHTNVSKQQVYEAFCAMLRVNGIQVMPEYTEFSASFNGVFNSVFPEDGNALRQVRETGTGDSVKGIYNFGFHPENYKI